MALTVEQFQERLVMSGLMDAPEAKGLGGAFAERARAAEKAPDAHAFARDLVQQNRLTLFQTSVLFQARASRLVLGDYEIIDKLGSGGMGEIFRAVDRRDKKVIALKVLPNRSMGNNEYLQRFQREVKVLSMLKHPNIVAAFDAGQQGDMHFLAMEYIEGGDLAKAIKMRGPFPVPEAVELVLQAVRGLAHAHAQNVIHRDIKPTNLMIDNRGVLKILDMGLARLVNTDEPLTTTGSVMGTIDYMAPEQAFETKAADARADIYSLGCTLHYLLTGNIVYPGENLMRKALAHRDAPIPSLRQLRSDVTPRLEIVFQRMLAKNPDDRYQTMNEVVAVIELCGQDFTAGAGRPKPMTPRLMPAPTGPKLFGGAKKESAPAIIPGALPGMAPRPKAKGTTKPVSSRGAEVAMGVQHAINNESSDAAANLWMLWTLGFGLVSLVVFAAMGMFAR